MNAIKHLGNLKNILPLLPAIMSDIGRKFNSNRYLEWCMDLGIKFKYSFSGHPYTNKQVEATNKKILRILKNKVTAKKGSWVEELPGVLWVCQATIRILMGKPFFLSFIEEKRSCP